MDDLIVLVMVNGDVAAFNKEHPRPAGARPATRAEAADYWQWLEDQARDFGEIND